MVGNRLLKTVRFSETEQWNVKYFFSTSITSKYPISNIGKHVIHISKKTKLSEDPEKEWRILGISNEVGMFDAYTEWGRNIKQPYIYVEDGCLAYNPYRINVGSIGLKTDKLLNEYISPAYVVFKCRETILPEYLLIILKSSILNILIRENTTGSVRQTLSYEKLAKIKIPVPSSLEEQRKIVNKYKETMIRSQTAKKAAVDLEKSIDDCLFDLLGIHHMKNNKRQDTILGKTTFKNLFGWGAQINLNPFKPQEIFRSNQFSNLPLEHYCEINPKTAYPLGIEQVSFVPMESVSDVYGEIVKNRVGETANSKGFTRFMEKDILWAKITPCMQNGKCAIANHLKNGCGYGSTEFHILRPNEKALPEYIYCFLRTRILRKAATTYFTGSAGQQRVGADFLEAVTIPDIPLRSKNKSAITQEKIVSEIFAIKDRIKAAYAQSEALRKKADDDFTAAVFVTNGI
ncbi:MAG: hypothetical protein HFK04_00625 [Oscillospiraceae bacterium]|nr:hypothetical protein [Oscillospiraceae bacterium]